MGAALFLMVLNHPSPCAVDLARPYEPVVVVGSEVTLFLNAPVQELFVYSFVNGSWKQIAFQIDEKDDGTFSASAIHFSTRRMRSASWPLIWGTVRRTISGSQILNP